MAAQNYDSEVESDFIQVPIEWDIPEDITGRFANNIVVQHTDHEFIISFFEILPPILLGSREEQEKVLNQIGPLKAKCVSQIIVSAGKMPDFIQALQSNLDRYLARKGEVE